jgi:LmbE family N-acetylglucosaminyl deacetylase
LVFSPHPDDETLGCGGLIQRAKSAGATVTIAFLTNGDGFRVAVERQFRELHVGPEDYIRFASHRQKETLTALGALGVSRDDVLFLGYPDRGLLPLWTDNWSSDRLFRSPYTQHDHSPYDLAFRPGAAYCGRSVLEDVEQVLRRERPTDIYVTHPSDDHPDHTAASSFVTLALDRIRDSGEAWAKRAHLHYFIVHRGDWPVPQGMYKTDPLSPPSEMAALDTKWQSLGLTSAETEAKGKSILAYESQTAVMKRFLVSFARKSEIFGTLGSAQIERVSSPVNDDLLKSWAGSKPVIRDPVNDSLLRDFQGGGDVSAVYAAHDSSRLYMRILTHQAVSPSVEFKVKVRYFGDRRSDAGGGTYTVSVRPGKAVSPAETIASSSGNAVDLSIPLRDIGYAHRLALNIDTLFAGMQVDRTGYRFLEL